MRWDDQRSSAYWVAQESLVRQTGGPVGSRNYKACDRRRGADAYDRPPTGRNAANGQRSRLVGCVPVPGMVAAACSPIRIRPRNGGERRMPQPANVKVDPAFPGPDPMKAWVLGDPGELSLVDKPVPVPKSAEVLVRIDGVAICATDLEIIEHGPP